MIWVWKCKEWWDPPDLPTCISGWVTSSRLFMLVAHASLKAAWADSALTGTTCPEADSSYVTTSTGVSRGWFERDCSASDSQDSCAPCWPVHTARICKHSLCKYSSKKARTNFSKLAQRCTCIHDITTIYACETEHCWAKAAETGAMQICWNDLCITTCHKLQVCYCLGATPAHTKTFLYVPSSSRAAKHEI